MRAGGKTDTGSCYALYAPKVANLKPIGEWNSVRLIIKPGNHVEHHMNGQLLCSYQIGSKDWNDRVSNSKFKNWEKFGKVGKGTFASKITATKCGFATCAFANAEGKPMNSLAPSFLVFIGLHLCAWGDAEWNPSADRPGWD